jgi:hypothetical protein
VVGGKPESMLAKVVDDNPKFMPSGPSSGMREGRQKDHRRSWPRCEAGRRSPSAVRPG